MYFLLSSGDVYLHSCTVVRVLVSVTDRQDRLHRLRVQSETSQKNTTDFLAYRGRFLSHHNIKIIIAYGIVLCMDAGIECYVI